MTDRRMGRLSWLGVLLFAIPLSAQESAVPPSLAGFPNSPEGAYKALLFAMGAGDEPAIRAVTVTTPGLARLLETTRIPAEKLPMLRDQLLQGSEVKRLKAGDTVKMGREEVYAVKVSDVVEGHAMVQDGMAGTLPIRCRVENGRWRVDARLIIAARRVAGVVPGNGEKGPPRRSIAMPSPLTGPPYPNTPEGASRTFLVAYLTADEANLNAVALPKDGFEWLLKRAPCSFEQAAKYRVDLDRHLFRTLKPGEAFEINGRKMTITSKDVTSTRAVVSADFPSILPTPCELIDGKWWVDPRPLIISLKAEAKAKAKPAASPAAKP